MSEIDYSVDRFERVLNEKITNLQECQKQKSYSSCSQCESFIECSVRAEYVKAVYESMSKGQQGSFDFN